MPIKVESFNSSLVRLKGALLRPGIGRSPGPLFQFQPGSIKGGALKHDECTQRIVSIPAWFD